MAQITQITLYFQDFFQIHGKSASTAVGSVDCKRYCSKTNMSVVGENMCDKSPFV